MPFSYFRRASALLAFAYVGWLVFARGPEAAIENPPPGWERVAREKVACVQGRLVSGFTENRLGWRARLLAEREGLEPASMWVYFRRGDSIEALRPGQKIEVEGKLRLPRWPRNPGDFDERLVASQGGVTLILHAAGVFVLEPRIPWNWNLHYWAESVRRSIHRVMRRRYSWDACAIVEGILIGSKRPMSDTLTRAIRDTGIVHLLVASGTNAALVAAISLWLCGFLGLSRLWTQVLTACLCGFYGCVAGWDPPYLRAFLCVAAGFSAQALEREPDHFQVWLLSGWVILLARPDWIFAPGFQLSYLAVLALLVVWPRWRPAAHRSLGARVILGALAASVSVQLMLAPLLAHFFGRVSIVGILGNVVLVPVAGLIFMVGFAVWGLALAPMQPMLQPMSALLGFLVRGFERVCLAFAAVPGAAIDIPAFGVLEGAAYYLAIFGFFVLRPRSNSDSSRERRHPLKRFQWRVPLLLWAAGLLLLVASRAVQAFSIGPVRILFMSQPGKRAALVTLPEGENLLFDANVSASLVRRCLRRLGVSRLQALFLNAQQPAGPGDDYEFLRPLGIGRENIFWACQACRREWPRGILVETRAEGWKLSYRDFWLQFQRSGTACGGLNGARSFCVRTSSRDYWESTVPEPPPALGAAVRFFDTRFDGAVSITSDGVRLQATTREDRHEYF